MFGAPHTSEFSDFLSIAVFRSSEVHQTLSCSKNSEISRSMALKPAQFPKFQNFPNFLSIAVFRSSEVCQTLQCSKNSENSDVLKKF